MAITELAMSFDGLFFMSRGRSNQKGQTEKGDRSRFFERQGLRGNGSKKKEKIGRTHNRAGSRRPR
jgi:hypothetical protein